MYTKKDLKKKNFEKIDSKFYKPVVGEFYRENGKYYMYFKNGWEEVDEQFVLNFMNSKCYPVILEEKVINTTQALCDTVDKIWKELGWIK